MSQPTTPESFLLPEQEAMIEQPRQLLEDHSITANPSIPVARLMMSILNGSLTIATEQGKYMEERHSELPDINCPDDLLQHRRYTAMAKVLQDAKLANIIYCLAIYQGISMAESKETDVAKAKDAGRKLREFRTGVALTDLLIASNSLFATYKDAGLETPVWIEAQRVHEKKKRPTLIDVSGEEMAEYNDLIDKALEANEKIPARSPLKLGRNRLLNGVRLAKFLRKTAKESGDDLRNISIDTISSVTEQSLAICSQPVKLQKSQVWPVVRITGELMHYVRSAGQRNPSILQDPRVQYAFFLNREIKGYDIKTSQEEFERDARFTATRVRRAALSTAE